MFHSGYLGIEGYSEEDHDPNHPSGLLRRGSNSMRNMSFSLTTPQVRSRQKDVTRRIGWSNLRPGEHIMAVEKAMGLKRGEKIVKICELVCQSNTQEPLNFILIKPIRDGNPLTEVEREGFPDISPGEFVQMFCSKMGISPDTNVNRIEFRFVDPSPEVCNHG